MSHTRSVKCHHSLEILNRLPFKIVSSERIGFQRFLTVIKPRLKLIFNSSILIQVSNWDLKRGLNRLEYNKRCASIAETSDVQLTLNALYVAFFHFLPKKLLKLILIPLIT